MKIQVGKYYRRADGNVVGPMKMVDPNLTDTFFGFDFTFGGYTYREDGKISTNKKEHPWDLVSEVKDV